MKNIKSHWNKEKKKRLCHRRPKLAIFPSNRRVFLNSGSGCFAMMQTHTKYSQFSANFTHFSRLASKQNTIEIQTCGFYISILSSRDAETDPLADTTTYALVDLRISGDCCKLGPGRSISAAPVWPQYPDPAVLWPQGLVLSILCLPKSSSSSWSPQSAGDTAGYKRTMITAWT